MRAQSQLRIKLSDIAQAVMSVVEVAGSRVQSGERPILITTLDEQGLSMLTSLRFPVRQDYKLGFQISINGHKLYLTGECIWQREEGSSLYRYGVRFVQSVQEREALWCQLAGYSHPVLPDRNQIHELYNKMSSIESELELSASMNMVS
ncbi:PilZ domain-containing protein [Paenibacillus tarimensis]|uniref:PilZ domain-containing protein n=1 Tax=Paenibacillus tarimensis TaxID=416012 RepID=UPI0039EF3DDA